MTVSDRIRVKDVRVLSENYATLKDTTFEWRRANGEWQTQSRETFDRGNAATLLPYNLAQRTVVLVRQFRYPAYVNGYDDLLIEAAAGLLDNDLSGSADSRRSRRGNRLPARRNPENFRSLHEPRRGHREAALLCRGIRAAYADRQLAAASPTRAKISRCWNCRSIRRWP